MVGLPRPVDHAEDDSGGRARARCLVGSRYDDELWELVPDGPPEPHLAEFVRSLPRAENALDLGCGDGRLSAELDAAHLTLADVSSVALERAARRLPQSERIELTPDAAFPLEDNAYGAVLCTETLEHVRDVQLFLSETRRVLVPGGSLALTTPALRRLRERFDPLSPHIRFFTRRSLRRLLDEMGFEVSSIRRRRGSLLAVARRP